MMNKMPRLSKSGVEYIDYSWGIFSGCRNLQEGICQVKACWAKSLSQRFTDIFPNGFEPTFYPEAIHSPTHLQKPSIISVGWMGDIIGYCKSVSEQSLIYQTIMQNPRHTFLFLTKNLENLSFWSPFPANAGVGVTITNGMKAIEDERNPLAYLRKVESKIKYISFEPLLSRWDTEAFNCVDRLAEAFALAGINWVIIGQQTPIRAATTPKIEWIKEIVQACDKAIIPVFLKNNLMPLLLKEDKLPVWAMQNWERNKKFELRQEFPNA